MSTPFTIPPDADKANAMLTKLGALATATDWKRAAIVYARTRIGQPGTSRSVNNDQLTCRQFAKLGIVGLRSHATVSHYRRIWQRAIDKGLAEPVSLGDTVTLPDVDWTDRAWWLDEEPEPQAAPDTQEHEIRVELLPDFREQGHEPAKRSTAEQLQSLLISAQLDRDTMKHLVEEQGSTDDPGEVQCLQKMGEVLTDWAAMALGFVATQDA